MKAKFDPILGKLRQEDESSFSGTAADVPFDNSGSNLTSTDTEAAVKEVNEKVDNIPAPSVPDLDAVMEAGATAVVAGWKNVHTGHGSDVESEELETYSEPVAGDFMLNKVLRVKNMISSIWSSTFNLGQSRTSGNYMGMANMMLNGQSSTNETRMANMTMSIGETMANTNWMMMYGPGMKSIGMNNSQAGIVIMDMLSNLGLVGMNYFGANYTDNTYVQKKFVTNLGTYLSEYADDAAAGTGGLVSGDLYKSPDGSGGYNLKIKS